MSYYASDSSDDFDDVLLKNVCSIALKVRPPNVQKELDDAVLISDSSSEGSDCVVLDSQLDNSSFAEAAPANTSMPRTDHQAIATCESLPSQESKPPTDPSEAFHGAKLSSGGDALYRVDCDGSDGHTASSRRAQNCSTSANDATAARANNASKTPAEVAAGDDEIFETKRGKYDRKDLNVRKKLSHENQAAEHLLLIRSSGLGQPCGADCFNRGTCGDSITKNELYRCHEYSYGTTYLDKSLQWQTGMKTQRTQQQWREKMTSFASYDDSNRVRFKFVAAGREVCEDYARAAYGITRSAWISNISQLRKGPGQLEARADVSEWNRQAREALKTEKATSMKEAVQWWMLIFPLWDAIPNEYIIKHPRLIWDRLFWEDPCAVDAVLRFGAMQMALYQKELSIWGTCPPFKSQVDKKTGASTTRANGSWYRARTEALRRYSIQLFGIRERDPGDTQKSMRAEPTSYLKLKARADHSNYAECNTCRSCRLRVEALIESSAPREEIEKERSVQMAHVQAMMAERDVCYELASESLRSGNSVFCLDDKLGSHWQFLPIPRSGRDGKSTAGRWRYRQCLQGNSYPGIGNFMSVVPPMLHTGSNFGCTAFVHSLYRLIHQGKILPDVKRIVRQTDGGSDNVAWVTHAVHFTLVREGAFNQIDWIRLEPGHSHNLQDQTFATTKNIFLPRRGAGVGCASPFEFEAMIVDGLKKMNGGCEILWQLANYNFMGFFDGCIASDFAHYGNERYWRYKHAPKLVEHGCVHVSFKTKLTDKATDATPEFKPFMPTLQNVRQMQTDPRGIQFVLEPPDISKDPGVEPWEGTGDAETEDGDGWNREKVVRDVLKTAEIEKFSASQVAEWNALFDFHTKYQTADSVPPTPIHLRVRVERDGVNEDREHTLNGMPVPWSTLWSTLRGRFLREHLSNIAESSTETGVASTAESQLASDMPEQPLALVNSVTGINHRPADRTRAAQTSTLRTRVSSMPLSAPKVMTGQLYLIALENFEGEFRVGLGRADDAVCPKTGGRHVSWLARRNWSNDPNRAGFEWPDNPTFDAAREADGRRLCQSFEPLNCFLPVPVQLTSTANYEFGIPLTHRRQFIRLLKTCISQLREFCAMKRPDLLRTCAQVSPEECAADFTTTTTGRAASCANRGGKRPQQPLSSGSESSVDSSDVDSSDGENGSDADAAADDRVAQQQGTAVAEAGSSEDAVPLAQLQMNRPRRARSAITRFA